MSNITIKNTQIYTGTALVSGGTQGAVWHDGKLYQFGNGGYCQVLDADMNKLESFQLPAYADNGQAPHCSSVEWIVPGQKVAVTTNATGLVAYADRFYVYDISDTSNITQEVVMMQCTNASKYARMACMAYDRDGKVMYVAGYTSGASKDATSPCWFEAFDMSGYVDNGTLTAPLLYQTESNGPGMHLQDGGFYNGYIYYLCDRDDTTNSAYNGLYIWVLKPNFETVVVIDGFPGNTFEGESFALAPEEHALEFITSIYKNGITYFSTRIGSKVLEPALTLSQSVNVVGYTVNGVANTDQTIQLEAGEYDITPILKENAVWSRWSDDDSAAMTRHFSLTATDLLELTAYAVQETVYLVGSPAPITQSTKGTSVSAQGTASPMYFIVSTNTTYPNEYMLVSDGKQNDGDMDIVTTNSYKMGASETQYFAENNITQGMYFMTEMPYGYTKATVTITAGTGEDNTPGSRNPHVIFCTGDSVSAQAKIYGSTDVYRPLDTTVTTTGFTFDTQSLKIKDGTSGAYTLKSMTYILVRIGGNAARLNNSYATIHFSK